MAASNRKQQMQDDQAAAAVASVVGLINPAFALFFRPAAKQPESNDVELDVLRRPVIAPAKAVEQKDPRRAESVLKVTFDYIVERATPSWFSVSSPDLNKDPDFIARIKHFAAVLHALEHEQPLPALPASISHQRYAICEKNLQLYASKAGAQAFIQGLRQQQSQLQVIAAKVAMAIFNGLEARSREAAPAAAAPARAPV